MNLLPTNKAVWATVDRRYELAGVSTRPSGSTTAYRAHRRECLSSVVSALATRLSARHARHVVRAN